MPPEKRNHFLDADESDDEQSQGYNSEADELSKGGRSAKRRKVQSDSEDDGDLSGGEEDERPLSSPTTQLRSEAEQIFSGPANEDDDEAAQEEGDDEKRQAQTKREPKLVEDPANIIKKNLVVTEAQIKKSGVVYLSRVPPFMKPTKLRSLLAPYGKINRIFLSPEDPDARKRRVRQGGNKRRNFTDGWVEFVRKKDAKVVCEVLNGHTIGGKKGSFYRDDIWTLLYLKGFKWHNLTEQISAENAERESRMRAEISKATRENKEFVRNVERAKVLDGMEAKKVAKLARSSGAGEGGAAAAGAAREAAGETGADGGDLVVRDRPRIFKQVAVASKKGEGQQEDQVKRVLSKIF